MKNTAIAASEADSNSLQILERVVRKHGFGTDHFDYPNAILELNEIVPADIRIDADGLLEAALSRMGFCDLVAYQTTSNAIAASPSIQAALARGPASKLLITAHLDGMGEGWFTTIADAAKVVVADAARRSGLRTRDLSIVSVRNRHEVWGIEERDYTAISSYHVLVNIGPDDEMPDIVRDLRDDHLSLEPTLEAVRFALARTTSLDIAEVPDPWMLSTLPSRIVDLIVDRYPTASAIVSTIETMAAASMERKAKQARSAADASTTDEKPKLGRYGIMPTQILRPTSPRVEDLSGYGRAAEWAQDLALDVADYRAGRVTWADVDGGCLLFGPPGTGKTTFARAVAASCDLPLIATSYTDWQSQGEAHGGTLVKTMRQRFNDAMDNAPCVVFIDEIDAFPARGSAGSNEGWWRPITTALLECLDGSVRRDGVVVLAACNDPSNLDPALVRSGRLDRRFEIGLPDETALRGIIAYHLPDAGEDVIDPVATVLAGSASGADIARFAREARRAARRARREVTGADLLAVAMPADTRSDALRWQIAVHEAGHALAVMAQGRIPGSLSLVESAVAHGQVDTNLGEFLGRIEDVDARVVVLLAGRAAEEVVLGRITAGASTDLQRATEIVADALARWGLGTRLRASGTIAGEAVETHLRRLYVEATEVIGQHRDVVEALARLALERRILGRAALAAFAAEHGFAGGQS